MGLPFVVALVAMAASLCALMAGAWVIQQRTGNSGWVDTTWTFATGFVGVVAALWPFAAQAFAPRQFIVAALVLGSDSPLGLHIAIRSAGIHDDPRYAEYAKQWGPAAP